MNAAPPKTDKNTKAAPVAAAPAAPARKPRGPVDSRGKIYDDILQTIGNTPLVRLPNYTSKHKIEADIMAKLEYFNPLCSIKDRVAFAMFEEAERLGKIKPGKTILIESSAGNTALSLAAIASIKGYKLMLVMPENVALDRRKMLQLFGAELILTPGDKGTKGSIEKAQELMAKTKQEMFSFNQFENPAGVDAHAETTAEEIWKDTDGKVDILVAGVGTGATITGISKVLRKKKDSFRAYAVEPAESAVLSEEKPNQHKIHGIGVGFISAIYDPKVVDGIVKIDSTRALDTAREIAQIDGVPAGISCGAALAAATDIAALPANKGKMIVVIFPSCAERYTSTTLFETTGR